MATTKRAERAGHSLSRIIVLILLLAGWAFVLASLVGFDIADPPTHVVWPANAEIANWCGPFGAMIAATLFKLLGYGAWLLVVFVGLGIFSLLMGSRTQHALVRLLGLVLLACAAAGLQHIVLPGTGPMPDLAGGLVGKVGATELSIRFGGLGAGVFLLVGAMIGALVAFDEWLIALVSWGVEKTREHAVPAMSDTAKSVGSATGELALAAGAAAGRGTAKVGSGIFSTLMEAMRPGKRKKKAKQVRLNDLDDDATVPTARKLRKGSELGLDEAEVDPVTGEPLPKAGSARSKPAKPAKPSAADVAAELDEQAIVTQDAMNEEEAATAQAMEDEADDANEAEEEEDDSADAPTVYTEDQLRDKLNKLPILFGQKDKHTATQADLSAMQAAIEEGEKYRFPGLDLLEEPEQGFSQILEATVKEQAQALIKALQQFKIEAEVDSVESGPVITLFHVRLSPGTKVSVLEAVSKDIARVLKAQNIRIVPNMAGRDTVGIEVPNLTKEKVRMKELMGRTDRYSSMKLPMFLGKDASGEPLIEDLTKMPHMLIAGTTGSGKSVCMNTIIMGFLYSKKPSELKMVLVDPKMVEMSQFKDIPHLMCPVVTEMSKAAAILEWACVKMDERYELLAEAGCRDIAAYNDLTWDELKERLNLSTPEEEAKTPRKLPYMVFIIDELADLMMTNKDVESHIIRIAQKARAVGMHLILATQRPQANVVTGLIKSNMPCRCAFKVASGMDSRIVLDQKGAELLLGHGDMLILTPRSSKLTRAQGTLVDDREIRKVVKFMKEVAAPSFERSLVQIKGPAGSDEQRLADSQNNSSASLQAAQEDPLFNRAVEIVLETKRGSVSLLQRRLAIGYTRASRLVDLMGIAGIISDHKGSVARDVLITLDDWATIQRLAAEEAKAKGIVLRHETEDDVKNGTASAPASVKPPTTVVQPGLVSDLPPFDPTPKAKGPKKSLSDVVAGKGNDDAIEDSFHEPEAEEEVDDRHYGDIDDLGDDEPTARG